MQSNLHTYQQCLSVYSIWIKSNIDQDQKDYYKECTNMVIWYGRHWGDRIQLIFFKDKTDYRNILDNKSFAWRVEFIIGVANSTIIHPIQQENG